MERLIWITWRAFWIGLGASLVLIAQAFAPMKITVMPRDEVKIAPVSNGAATSVSVDVPAPAPTMPKSADPILSRNPFDSKTGSLVRRKS